MKTKEQYMETYATPQVEIIEVEIEKGFSVTGTGEIEPM